MKDNNFKRYQVFSCLTAIAIIVVMTLLISFCTRIVTDKEFIDNTIENIHDAINHVDSVWKGGNHDNTESNDSTQGVQ